MNSGWPPTAPKARAGLFTPPGNTRLARSKASRLRPRVGGMGEFSSFPRECENDHGGFSRFLVFFRFNFLDIRRVFRQLHKVLVRVVLVELADVFEKQIGFTNVA